MVKVQDQQIWRIKRLLEVARSLGNAQEVEDLLHTVVTAAYELSGSEGSAILLYEDETNLLKFAAGHPAEKETLKRVRIPVENSLAGYVFQNSKPVIVNNTQSDQRIVQGVERALSINIQSLLAVPMIFRGETIGVIEAINKSDKAHYTEEDVTILETLASQAAVALLSTLMLEETKRAYHELEEQERLKTEFIAIASHELRTPLGLIIGHATFLKESVRGEDAQQVDVILRSASRLKKIIEDLSNVNQYQSGKSRLHQCPVDMEKLIAGVLDSFQKTARDKAISLGLDAPKQKIIVQMDEEKVRMVLGNLIENALCFTDSGGHVLVTVDKLPGYAKISVIDDGIGIPAKDISRVFDRFYQVDSHLTRRHGGMGLGLTVARAMIELHNGQIWVESVEGKGSSFSFLLPFWDEKEETRPVNFGGQALPKPFG